MFQSITSSPVTSLLGLGPLLVGLGHIFTAISNKQMPDVNDIALVSSGLMGLFAKDGNVTGGTKKA